MSTSKTVGVLGGMGPYATAAFFQKLVSLTPATRDWEHLRIVIDNNPHIPSRSRHLLYGEQSPLQGMIETCRKLEAYPVDFIAVPCNSAAVFVAEVQRTIDVPVLNICEIATGATVEALPGARRIAVLGGRVTYDRRTYEPLLIERAREYIDHGEAMQRRLESLIERLKLGAADESVTRDFRDVIDGIKREHAADAAILACTEFGCLVGHDAVLPVVDSSLALARHVVALATAEPAYLRAER
jgi:aspartate racemase